MGGGWGNIQAAGSQMKTSDQMQIDFAASMVNETDKTYIVNMGFVMPADDGTGIPFSVETLKAEMIQSGLDETMTQSGMITLGTKEYEYLKVNYGKLMADSMKDYMNTAELTEGQKGDSAELHQPDGKMLVNDFYIRQEETGSM